jgi:hypothetical protein
MIVNRGSPLRKLQLGFLHIPLKGSAIDVGSLGTILDTRCGKALILHNVHERLL